MLQFFSASTSIVNSKRAITECLENALEGQANLNCDLIIIYSAMGHNFQDLLTEAHKLSPDARIVGCTGAGIICKDGPDESMKALSIMVIKGPKNEFAVTCRESIGSSELQKSCLEMACELKSMNPHISMIQFLPHGNDLWPIDKALEDIQSVFGSSVPVFGGVSMSSMANVKSVTEWRTFQFFDQKILEKGAVMIGYADPTLKFISHANHGFSVIEGMPLEVTRSRDNIIIEFNWQPAWKILTEILGVPETTTSAQINTITGFAKELPAELQEENGSPYILFAIMLKNEDESLNVAIICPEGMKILLTRRDEKKMFEGVDWMVKKILNELNGKKPVAVFHADCVLRGRFSLDRILKDEIIKRMQAPICQGENVPWLGLYSAGEFARLGGESWFQQMSSSLFVIYR